MDNEILEFRNGIFSLHTRRFGTIAEIMIQELYDLNDSNNSAFDKSHKDTNERIEIKFSRVMEAEKPISKSNAILSCKQANFSNRVISSIEKNKEFDCNIQQVKCKEFDILYYGVFFKDHIEIFKMTNDEVKQCPGYSDKQHRGNIGEGQFHINNKTITYHRENNLQQIITYEELFNLFKKNQ